MRKLQRALALPVGLLVVPAQISPAQQPTTPRPAPLEARRLEAGRPVERELKAKETHAYEIALGAGQFLDAAVNQRGVDVVVRVFAPDGRLLAEIDSPNGARGDEPVALEAKSAGTYRVEVSPLAQESEASPGRYEIRINEILSPEAYARRLAEKRRRQQIVISWLRENAIPIKTVEAGSGFDDLRPLKRVFAGVRFVGLGEETHGTREFFQFKHRMLEFLVSEMGFRVFAIEASYSACQDINDYVMGRAADGAKALDGQGFWTWNTEEVRAMLDWMRAYNAAAPEDRKVKFVGFDIQNNDAGKARLLEYLRRVAPERATQAEIFFRESVEDLGRAAFLKDDEGKAKDALSKLRELKNLYNDLFVFLEISGPRLAAKSGRAEYEQAREYARVIAQYIDVYGRTDSSGSAARDLYMADNFRRLVEREPAGTRFVVWAHNGHVAAGGGYSNYPTFGHYLRGFYGGDYYALGFSFNRGSFQARELRPKDPAKRLLSSFTVAPAPDDSIDWYLARAGVRSFVIDLRAPRRNADIDGWVAAPRPMRAVGSMYAPDMEAASFAPVALSKEFDGLFFIDTTTRARPNPSVKDITPDQ